MPKKIKKKIIHTRKEIKGKDRKKRLEEAYSEWKLGTNYTLQQLADKYHVHLFDVSQYITMKLQIERNKKDQS